MQKGRKKWQPGAMEIPSEDQNVLVWESCVIPLVDKEVRE